MSDAYDPFNPTAKFLPKAKEILEILDTDPCPTIRERIVAAHLAVAYVEGERDGAKATGERVLGAINRSLGPAP